MENECYKLLSGQEIDINDIKEEIAEELEMSEAEKREWEQSDVCYILLRHTGCASNAYRENAYLRYFNKQGMASAILFALLKAYRVKYKEHADYMRLSNNFCKFQQSTEFVDKYRAIKYHFNKKYGLL